MNEKQREPLNPRLVFERKRGAAMTAKSQETERTNVAEGKSPWPMYEPDARTYVESFSVRFPEAANLKDHLHTFREAGDTVVVVDLCGVSDASSIGADHTICLTLKKWPDRATKDTQTIVEGDIFKSGSIERVIEEAEKHGGKIHCLFLRAVGGLGGHGHNMRSHLRLYSALQKLYPLLAENGDIYIELVGFQGMQLLPEILNAQSPAPIAESKRIEKTDGYFADAVHIRKLPGAASELQTLDELDKQPEIKRRFGELLSE